MLLSCLKDDLLNFIIESAFCVGGSQKKIDTHDIFIEMSYRYYLLLLLLFIIYLKYLYYYLLMAID